MDFLLNEGSQERLLIGNHALDQIIHGGGNLRLATRPLGGLATVFPPLVRGSTTEGVAHLFLGVFQIHFVPNGGLIVAEKKAVVRVETRTV
jgi:hypothetical protein